MNKKLLVAIFSIILFVTLIFVGSVYAIGYLEVSLSDDTPPGGFISPTSTNVAFVSVDFTNTASSTEAITIEDIAFKNYGTSSSTNQVLSRWYLYDDTGLIASSTDYLTPKIAVFYDINYVIPTSTVKTLTFKGDLGNGATSSETIIVGINNESFINTSPTSTEIFGEFPIIGNTFTIE